ncbi:MAG: ATP-binding protein [Bdellovibrionota bacterium]
MRLFAPLNQDLIPSLQNIEISSTFQIPFFQIVGLPSLEVSEARERVRAAMDASGYEFPRRRIILNLSPSSVRKRGTGLDLPMALGVLAAGETDDQIRILAWGELGLDGNIRSVGQALRTLYCAWSHEIPHLLTSVEDISVMEYWIPLIYESKVFDHPPPILHAIGNLKSAWETCEKIKKGFAPLKADYSNPIKIKDSEPFSTELLPLSPSLERTVGLAASGFHHLLILGPKGVGKSRVLDWLIQSIPPLDSKTQIDHRLLAELLDCDPKSRFLHHPAVRKVSSHAKPAALLGSAGTVIRPGEFSLAHGGLLIADELPEWPRDSRESFREPLETGVITITRVLGSCALPARFALAATGNLCPCGGWPNDLPQPEHREGAPAPISCDCSLLQRKNYLRKLSGPILDRIDLVRIVSSAQLGSANPDLLKQLQARVIRTRGTMIERWGGVPGQISAGHLESLLRKYPWIKKSLDGDLSSSLRGRHKLFRLVLTISAWDQCESPNLAHLTEARSYRPERLGSLGGTPA